MRANLIVRSLDGKVEQPIAKTVDYRGRQVVHAYVYGKYMKHTTHAWGVRFPLAKWMDEEGVRDLYFWDNKRRVTYHIDLDVVRMRGAEGKPDQFGGTLNVPHQAWEVIDHKLKVEWVPDEHVLVLPQCDEPWPLPERYVPEDDEPEPQPRRRRKPEPAKTPQLALFG